ncbi:MAG: ribonuclease III domain-containing protein [Myxococcota bacterium]
MSADRAATLDAFEARLGYAFRDRARLETALRHASRSFELEGAESNERLEFLGDAVVGLVVAHRLFAAHPTWGEGELTRATHALVDERAHARLAAALGIADVVELGATVRASAASTRSARRASSEREGGEAAPADGTAMRRILANALEAVLGAMYLDGGLEPVFRVVDRAFASAFAPGASPPPRDPKTALQETTMARFGALPRYALVGDSLVEGGDDRFAVEVELPGGERAAGVGRSKRLAERAAARAALARLAQAPDVDAEGDGSRGDA